MDNRPVRVRFAPSPTGPLHMGGVRTALFNYLFAKKHGGTFILRIEDTDQVRFVPGAEAFIMESLAWCGLEYTEGPDKGGPDAPYRQSERKAIYRQYADQLVRSGNAYFAFDTPEELDALRTDYESRKLTFSYNAEERKKLKNSLALGGEETERRIMNEEPYVIRFRMPEHELIQMQDMIRGDISVDSSTLDDKVLFKAEGLPTYHLANVVDDYLMKVSHVIRGEEWLPSLPLHVLLYRYLGWEKEMPLFAHLPLILKPSGQGKLSKRDGDKLGFPVFPLRWEDPESGEVASGYRESGYFPEAFLNMLALLGWNPGTEKELFTLNELVNAFSLDRVGKSGARFDPEKTKWFNQQYLKSKPDSELADLLTPILRHKELEPDRAFVEKICGIIKERAVFVNDLWEQGWYFFKAPETYDQEVIKKRWSADIPGIFRELIVRFGAMPDFTANLIKETVHALATETAANFGNVMNCLRLCLVGSSMGPDLVQLCEMLGKEEVKNRIEKALDEIRPNGA